MDRISSFFLLRLSNTSDHLDQLLTQLRGVVIEERRAKMSGRDSGVISRVACSKIALLLWRGSSGTEDVEEDEEEGLLLLSGVPWGWWS